MAIDQSQFRVQRTKPQESTRRSPRTPDDLSKSILALGEDEHIVIPADVVTFPGLKQRIVSLINRGAPKDLRCFRVADEKHWCVTRSPGKAKAKGK